MKQVTIYADGACEGNPGPGGFAAVIEGDGPQRELMGAEPMTTNNRMELTAVIRALSSLKERSQVRVATDSQYVVLGMTKWIHLWRRNGWKTATKQPVKNQDLWEKLLELAGLHEVRWEWLRGHSGHRQNERADRLARQAINDLLEKKNLR